MTSSVKDQKYQAPAGAVQPEMFDHFADLLEEKRQTLLLRASEIMDDIEVLQTRTATHGQGETDLASSDVELALNATLEANTFTALNETALALARLEDGRYGLCTACGEPITADRLIALPHARHCITCQQLREQARR